MRSTPFVRVPALRIAAAVSLLSACDGSPVTSTESAATPPASVALGQFGAIDGWQSATLVTALSTATSLDGCPFISPDGRTFFIASDRPGGEGGLDIWIATRESSDAPWSAPVNAGPGINTGANEFCPTLARDGHTFYFVSNRGGDGVCGGDDIYVTRFRGAVGSLDVESPANVGCGVNSAANEASPFPFEHPGLGPVLYFSSNRAGGYSPVGDGPTSGDSDLYLSVSHGGAFGAAVLVPGANSAATDGQPNVRRDGLELFFFSNRSGALGNDIYAARRASAHDDWDTPINLGPSINSAASETRPSLSWDGRTLYFGSTRAGSNDIYVSSR